MVAGAKTPKELGEEAKLAGRRIPYWYTVPGGRVLKFYIEANQQVYPNEIGPASQVRILTDASAGEVVRRFTNYWFAYAYSISKS